MNIIRIDDERYPALLKEIHQPPRELYVKGELTPYPCVAIVGSRDATSYGIRAARALAADLARSGVTIVSGLARGVDAAAHEGALAGGGRTVAVLGCGLSTVYPAENTALAARIETNGALVSEFAPDAQPLPWNFPRRNRIISGLSSAIVVVEAGLKSGALITADAALEQGRDVFAVPGPIDSPASQGTNKLLRQGARAITCAQDVLEELEGVSALSSAQHAPRPRPADLSEAERALLALFDGDALHVDEFIEKSGLAAGKALGALSQLEMRGALRQLPGKYYQAQMAAHRA